MSTSNQLDFKQLNWLVIPGGPGLSTSYLKYGLANAFSKYKIHYYDPLGSPERKINRPPPIDELVEQIIKIIKIKKLENFGFITHSFGNYLAMRLLEKKRCKPKALIMISPMPFTAKYYKKALKNITAKIPNEIIEKLEVLSKNVKNGPKIFDLLFPYYANKHVKKLPRIPFDSNMCNKIAAQISNYDDTKLLLSCDIPWLCIMGKKDPFYLEKKLLKKKNTFLIPNVGHYPFYENQHAFIATVKKINFGSNVIK